MSHKKSYYSRKYKLKDIRIRKAFCIMRKNKIESFSIYNCIFCEIKAQLYHHINYDYPLLLIPMCIKCHRKLHTELKKRKITL